MSGKSTFGTVCDGIGCGHLAFERAGFACAWSSEIEPFPCALLEYRFPGVRNIGDMRGAKGLVLSGEIAAPDVLIGGTPCQAFSVAGKREGMDDERGNLSLVFCELSDAIDAVRRGAGREPATVLWENVPGVLSDKKNAFGCFLGQLSGAGRELQPPGGGWGNAGCVLGAGRTVAWRVLDSQYFGVAQRRRRVFVVASAGDRTRPEEILFEREGVRRDSPPSREKGQGFTHDLAPCLEASGRGVERCGETRGQDPVVAVPVENRTDGTDGTDRTHGETAGPLTTRPYADNACREDCLVVAQTLRGEGFDASEDGTGRGTPIVPVLQETTGTLCADTHPGSCTGQDAYQDRLIPVLVPDGVLAFSCKDNGRDCSEGVAPTLRAMGGELPNAGGQLAVVYDMRGNGDGEIVNTLTGDHASRPTDYTPVTVCDMLVRRLTPRECERLQGLPDDWTLIPWRKKASSECPDGPRYKGIGNGQTVQVMEWLAGRIKRFMVKR